MIAPIHPAAASNISHILKSEVHPSAFTVKRDQKWPVHIVCAADSPKMTMDLVMVALKTLRFNGYATTHIDRVTPDTSDPHGAIFFGVTGRWVDMRNGKPHGQYKD